MKIKFVGKNVEFTEAMKERTEEKLKRLDKYDFIISEGTEVRVLARTYSKHKQKVEITIPTKLGILRSEKASEDYYDSLDKAIDALEGQVRKIKTKLVKRHRPAKTEEKEVEKELEAEAKEAEPVREKQVVLEEISVEDAAEQMSMGGHDFYLFKDESTGNPSVVYVRHDGGYGLIEGR